MTAIIISLTVGFMAGAWFIHPRAFRNGYALGERDGKVKGRAEHMLADKDQSNPYL